MSAAALRSSENPFSSRFVRPGALPFLFADGETLASLQERFQSLNRRAAIVGPHGSGKSTLLAALAEAWRSEGLDVVLCELHDGQRRPPSGFAAPTTAGGVLLVDGYEQLGFWGRREVEQTVARSGCGLLVTTHRPLRRIGTLYVVQPTPTAARAVVQRLLAPPTAAATHAAAVDRETIERLFAAERGNIRELLFRLYDLYESQRP